MNKDTRLKLNPSQCGDIAKDNNSNWIKTSDQEQGNEDTIYQFNPSAPNTKDSLTLIVPNGASRGCTIEVYNQQVGNNQFVRLIDNGNIRSYTK